LLLLGISVLVICFGRKQRYLLLGWFWFVAALIPVIGIVQVGAQAYADRYTYVPYIGLFIMIAWLLPQLLSNWTSAGSVESPQRKIALGLSMVIVLTALGIRAHQQVSCWNNSVTLFSHAIKVTQKNYLAHNNLGNAYNGLGRWQEAIGDFKQAIKINPYYYEAYFSLGNAYSSLGRCNEAIDAYKQAVKIKLNYADAYFNLGNAYGSLGRWQEAIEAYKQGIRLKPDLAEAHNNLGVAYGKFGRGIEAIDAFKQAIRIKPDDAEAHYNLGYAYLAIGDKNSALAECNILKSLNLEFANNLFKEINK
jgi:tetratricopeptide (TPR) repeat protein